MRANRSRLLDTVTAWGYCAAKDDHYYGLKGHVMIHRDGYITACPVAPANVDERELLAEAADRAKGLLIGDKGYIGTAWVDAVAATGIDLQTPLRDNRADARPAWAVRQLLKVRKKVETVLSVLTEQFSFTKIKAHAIWHFRANRICFPHGNIRIDLRVRRNCRVTIVGGSDSDIDKATSPLTHLLI